MELIKNLNPALKVRKHDWNNGVFITTAVDDETKQFCNEQRGYECHIFQFFPILGWRGYTLTDKEKTTAYWELYDEEKHGVEAPPLVVEEVTTEETQSEE